MRSRLDLHDILCDILGTRNAYFQAPESTKMKYPAIRYSLSDIDNQHADDSPYIQSRVYQLIVIDKDPDSIVADKVAGLSQCSMDRSYTADNLNHFVFTLYF